MTHLLLGAGPAAINAIETIRQFDGGSSQITLVCDEPAYARMALPYYLANQIPQQQLFTGDDAYFAKLKVTRRIGAKAAKVDPQKKQVTLSDGSSLAFDDLLIATGASPAVPNMHGGDLPHVQPLWTLAQTEAILQAVGSLAKPEVLFVGAGFIGLIVLNAMYKRGWKLHVVEMAGQVLPRMLDGDSAAFVADWLGKKDVDLHVGTTVQKIEMASRAASAPGVFAQRKRVTLANGQPIECDLIILATGIKPNIDFLAGSGVKTDRGVLVNERMQANFPFIYAAGDVAQAANILGGAPDLNPIQPAAVDQGRIAGANMAGQHIAYPGSMTMNVLDVCGLQCASFGKWAGEPPASTGEPPASTGEPPALAGGALDATTINNPDRPLYRKLVWTGDQITGAIFVGPANDVGMLTDVGMVKGMIQTQTKLGPWKDYVRDNPFDVRKPYIACEVAKKLVATTLLGKPSQARGYRFGGEQPGPQVTRAAEHGVFVGNKGHN
jgi:NAD(P)H-nitrite reductase large subunit